MNYHKMTTTVVDRILHVIYNKGCVPSEIEDIATFYEGKINNRFGFNFPMKIVLDFYKDTKLKKSIILPYSNCAEYVIVYKKGDISTKKHEIQHAKFFMDQTFRQSVDALWNSLSVKYRDRVTNMLKKMNYPDSVLLDEFQAYYFTELPNFFGKIEYL